MKTRLKNLYRLYFALPIVGIACFVLLYVYASTLYPGGSQANNHSVGFDWMHNYWCNLLVVVCPNGLSNPARPFAIAATILLSISLMLFFIQFAYFYAKEPLWKYIISIGGIASMSLATLISTSLHDTVIWVSSIFGLGVVIGMIRLIYGGKEKADKIAGIICLILIAINNVIYYSGTFIILLPLLQKITFAIILIWFVSFSLRMRKSIK